MTILTKSASKVPRHIWFGLFLAVVLDTFIQLFWKAAVVNVPEQTGLIETAVLTLKQPAFIVVAITFACQWLNWLKVLSDADLSFAQPFTALSYISVCLASTLYFHESISIQQGFGVLLILLGVWFVSRTEHKTNVEAEDE